MYIIIIIVIIIIIKCYKFTVQQAVKTYKIAEVREIRIKMSANVWRQIIPRQREIDILRVSATDCESNQRR